MKGNELILVYCTSDGNASIQHLTGVKIQEDNKGQIKYIQGWSEKDATFKTLRGERVVDDCVSMQQAESLLKKFNEHPSSYGFKRNPHKHHISQIDTFDICFTGFKKADREALTELAKKNNMNVHVSVVMHLDMLCYGYNAGPKKLKKAMSQGAIIANREQFEDFLETGEIPEDV